VFEEESSSRNTCGALDYGQQTYKPSIPVDVIIQYFCVNKPHLTFILQNAGPHRLQGCRLVPASSTAAVFNVILLVFPMN